MLGAFNGLAWTENIKHPSTFFITIFVIGLTYTFAFYLLEVKSPWIFAGVFAAAFAVVATLPIGLQTGFTWQQMMQTAIEWFVVASIAALLAMLVPKQKAS